MLINITASVNFFLAECKRQKDVYWGLEIEFQRKEGNPPLPYICIYTQIYRHQCNLHFFVLYFLFSKEQSFPVINRNFESIYKQTHRDIKASGSAGRRAS